MSPPSELLSNITAMPRGGRDGFIAETAIRIDRLEAAAARLERDMEHARAGLLALLESAEQTKRLHTFEESLRNSREYKIDEFVRTSRDLKSRLDRLEGERSTFGALSYCTFEAVNKRLQELGRLETQTLAYVQQVKRSNYVFLAAMAVLGSTLAAYVLPALGLT